jgi:CheY-like chemotaxis protein
MKLQRILIVDNDFPFRMAMWKILQLHGYETCTCGSGEHSVLNGTNLSAINRLVIV